MALPNFFFKAALGATQLLRGVDDTRLADILNRTRIGVLFDAAAAASPEGRATLELSINLLARLYPRLAVVPYGPATDLFAERLSAEAHAINPEIEIVADPHALDATLIVGAPPVSVSGRTVYVGSQGWLARLSPTTPVPVGQSDNPFGAGAAACFGAAAVHVIGSITPHAELKRVSGSTEELTSIIQHRDPAAFLGWRHENDPTSELVVSELREGAQSVHDFRFAADRHTFIAVGNETAGVPEELVFRADTLVYIPMPGPGFCLNTSQTANVLLFEYVRQANEHRNATNVSAMVG
jgi:tRNA(Leu) C34 or U34 (ribose-2'-O)-methylase TrmL